VLILIVGLWVPGAAAQARWSVDCSLGGAWSLRTPLTITQDGHETLRFSAEYEGRSFREPLYYALRVARWKDNRAWEIEFLHQKLFLTNPPPEVQRFSISHGLNLVSVTRAWDRGPFVVRLGGGLILAHPESTIRDRAWPEEPGFFRGHELTGPSVQAGLARRFFFGERFYATLEGKVTVSHARVPVAGGRAELTNVAFHGLFGLGYAFGGSDSP